MKINRLITPYNKNVTSGRTIKYIVIHFVGGTGGAEANCRYFASKKLSSSAHYFVGHAGEVWQCVDDKDIAWHCGAKVFKHPEARNSNSIGIEMCCRKDPWRFEHATVDSAVELTRFLMEKYRIPISNVIRHYDVTGKNCPEPLVKDAAAWNNFKERCAGSKKAAPTPPSAPSVPSSKTSTGGNKERIKAFQTELNRQFNKRLAADGIWGARTEAAAVTIRKGSEGSLTKLLQQALQAKGINVSADGKFGSGTEAAVKKFQQMIGLKADGIVGGKTWKAVLN